MMCGICKEKIETTFLHKLVGTYVKDSKGKRHTVCNKCQGHLTQEEILQKL